MADEEEAEVVEVDDGNIEEDDEVIREDLYIARRYKEEEEEFRERLRQEEYKKKKEKPKSSLSSVMKRGLQKHSEYPEMKNIKKLLDGKPITVPKPKPCYGRVNIDDHLNADELMLLFKKFTFQGKVILSQSCPQWEQMLYSSFQSQIYLWFSNEEKNSKRYLPIEVCCEWCRHQIDSEPVIRVIKNFLLYRIIDEILSLTNNLKCLRLYRFEFNRIVFVKKLQENCPQLKHLDLTECYAFKLKVMKQLSHDFPLMNHLLLSSTDLDEEMLRCLVNRMKYLETLDVSATLIDGMCLIGLPRVLKRLDIRRCPNITKATLLEFAQKHKIKELQHLKMDAITARELYQKLSDRGKSLLVLEIGDYENLVLSAIDFLEPIRAFTHLQSLTLGRNICVNMPLMQAIIDGCYDMRSLSIQFSDYGERRLSDNNLATICRNWRRLERLEILNTPAAGSEFISELSRMDSLTYLNLTQCSRLRDDFFANMVKNVHNNINYLVVDNCHNLGKGTLDAAVIRANRLTHQVLRVSMLRCNLVNLPYLKSKLLPQNLRLTYSSCNGKRYLHFDGKRSRFGRLKQLFDYLNDN